MDKIAQAVDIGERFFGGPHFLRNITGIGQLVSILLNNAIVVAGVIFLFLVIVAGINFVTGGGSPEKLEQSKQILTYAIIGFIMVVGAYLIIRVIEAVTTVNILG